MVVSGLPVRNGLKHAGEIASLALHLRENIHNKFTIPHDPKEKLNLRIGIHSGKGAVSLSITLYIGIDKNSNVWRRYP